MNSELIKFTEVKDKRLLKATAMERKKLIFADNSHKLNLCAVVSPIFYWAGLEAFSNNKVTNVNVCTKNKPSFILRELYFIFKVVSVF